MLRFNVDGEAGGISGPTGIDGDLHDSKWEVMLVFCEHNEVRDSNESKVFS